MKRYIYAVRDVKSQDFVGGQQALFVMKSDGEAIRAFMGSLSNKDAGFSATPEDFELCRVGELRETQVGEAMGDVPMPTYALSIVPDPAGCHVVLSGKQANSLGGA